MNIRTNQKTGKRYETDFEPPEVEAAYQNYLQCCEIAALCGNDEPPDVLKDARAAKFQAQKWLKIWQYRAAHARV